LREAVRLAPDAPLIQIMLAQALLGVPGQANVDDAIANLRTALANETTSSMGYRQLAAAYARKADSVKGQARQQFLAQAELASAEAYFYEGQLRLAKEQAKRAKAGLANGSPNWIKADDILTFQIPTTN
jgi:predicted Zn-dependent protease